MEHSIFDNRVIIITDLEPDDLIAIVILLKSGNISPSNLSFVVSTWKDVKSKARYLHKLLIDYFVEYADVKIYLGEPSNAKYILPFNLGPEEDFPSYQNLNWSKNFIINLAPIRELIKLFNENSKVFHDCELAIYGSFNIRSVIWSDKIEFDKVYKLLYSFRKVIFYERFLANGDHSSMDNKILLDLIWNKYPFIAEMIKWWNDSILEESKRNCENNDPNSDRYIRSKKIIDNISHEPRQFVNADTGLISILLMNDIKPFIHDVHITFNPKSCYTEFNTSEKFTGIQLIKCSDETLYQRQIRFYIEALSA